MSQKAAKVWRGLTALFLSLSLLVFSMGGVAEQWRSVIDQNLGEKKYKELTLLSSIYEQRGGSLYEE